MASNYETLSLKDCNQLLAACSGLCISRVWTSPARPAVFLEVGRLKQSPDHRNAKGQITFMIQSDWRVEKSRSIQVGSQFSDRCIEARLPSLVRLAIDHVEIAGTIPEMSIRLRDGRTFTTFMTWNSSPGWSVGFKDRSMLPLHPMWKGIDVSLWICADEGRIQIEYCYDDSAASVRKAVAKMGFSAKHGWRCQNPTIQAPLGKPGE